MDEQTKMQVGIVACWIAASGAFLVSIGLIGEVPSIVSATEGVMGGASVTEVPKMGLQATEPSRTVIADYLLIGGSVAGMAVSIVAMRVYELPHRFAPV